jgi:hypothetical protein
MRLWAPESPQPDFKPIGRWLEVEGRDLLGTSLQATCVFLDTLGWAFSDSSIVDYGWVKGISEITDHVRVEFARDKIQQALDESRISVHVIELGSDKPPPAHLCFLVDDAGPSGLDFQYLGIYSSLDNFLEVNDLVAQLILDAQTPSDERILVMWQRTQQFR